MQAVISDEVVAIRNGADKKLKLFKVSKIEINDRNKLESDKLKLKQLVKKSNMGIANRL